MQARMNGRMKMAIEKGIKKDKIYKDLNRQRKKYHTSNTTMCAICATSTNACLVHHDVGKTAFLGVDVVLLKVSSTNNLCSIVM